MLCTLVEGRKGVHFSHIDFPVDLQADKNEWNHPSDTKTMATCECNVTNSQ